MKVLYIGEIVGKAGVFCFKNEISKLKQKTNADFVIACADAVTNNSGIGRNHAAYLRKLGADVLTTGECCFFKKDLTENFGKLPYVLRPENLLPEAPGFGCRIYKAGNKKIAVAVLLGQSFFSRIHSENPFSHLIILLERLRAETPFIIIDFHGASSAEKLTLFEVAAGKCSAVIGSHNRVQTGDEKLLAGSTAVITDAGRTGSIDSVGGTDIKSKISEYISGIPDWTRDAWDRLELQGVFIDINENGKATHIERIKIPVETPLNRE